MTLTLQLPSIEVDLSGRSASARASKGTGLRPGELTRLLSLDAPIQRHQLGGGGRCVPLADQRWAVARRCGDGVVWRLCDALLLRAVQHPAWLWTEDAWFDDVSLERGPAPSAIPLRHLIRQAAPLGGGRRATIKLLAATIAALRKGVPTAIVIDSDTLSSHPAATTWFGLALLVSLPASLGRSLRISTFESAPRVDDWELVLTDHAPEGDFEILRADDPPEEGADLVAYYVRNRLLAGDPEAVEAAANHPRREGVDPWGDTIKDLLRSGVPGLSKVSQELLERDPDGAVRAVVARLRAGAALDDDVADDLARTTARCGDPRPWRALVSRPAVERARAVQAWLHLARASRPRPELLRIVAALYPHGAPLEEWVSALLYWHAEGVAVDTIEPLLDELLQQGQRPASREVQISVQTELLLNHVARGQHAQAVAWVQGPLGQRLLNDGLPSVLVQWWVCIPSRHRPLDALDQLIERLAACPEGDQAARLLYLHLDAAYAQSRIDRLLKRWLEHHQGQGPLDDALISLLRERDRMGDWLRAVALTVPPEQVAEAVGPYLSGPDDAGWAEAEAAHGVSLSLQPRERFVALSHLFPHGIVALEPLARTLVADAIAQCTFPDPELCQVATTLTEVPVASALWMWVAVVSAPPQHFDEDTLDATVVAFCEDPPPDELDRMTALRAAESLGRASGWAVIDHARWLVRLCLSPSQDHSDFNQDLALAVLRGLVEHADGLQRLADITHALAELPPNHPALRSFLETLLPALWPRRAAPGYTKLVRDAEMNAMVRSRWRAAVK